MAKFKDVDEAEKQFSDLEKKLGEQGKELGETRQALQQHQAWYKEAAPIIDWYGKNEQEVKRRWTLAEQQPNGHPHGQQPNPAAGVVQQAAQVASQQPGFQWLSPEEKQAFIMETAQHISGQILQPWTQQFAKQAEAYAKQAQEAMNAQLKSHTDVIWWTLQSAFPPEKLKEIQALHAEALKYADPSKLDPKTMAQESLAMRAEMATLKAKNEEYEKKTTEREKAEAPSILGGAPPDAASTPAPKAATPDERRARVMDAVKTEHGTDGLHALFGNQAKSVA